MLFARNFKHHHKPRRVRSIKTTTQKRPTDKTRRPTYVLSIGRQLFFLCVLRAISNIISNLEGCVLLIHLNNAARSFARLFLNVHRTSPSCIHPCPPFVFPPPPSPYICSHLNNRSGSFFLSSLSKRATTLIRLLYSSVPPSLPASPFRIHPPPLYS